MQRSGGDKEIKRGIYTLNKPLERIKETVFLTSLQVTALLLDEEDLTTIITRTPFSLALLLTAAKSCMCVQNFRFNIAIFVLFFFVTVNLEFLLQHIFTSHCQMCYFNSSSFFIQVSLLPSFLWALSRAGLRPGLGSRSKKKKKSPIHLTRSLTFSVCLLFMWMASSVSQAQFWMVTFSL